MKNAIEVPTELDFHKTESLEITLDQELQCHKAHYRKAAINMRGIIDFTSVENELSVIDETKVEEYKKAVSEFRKKYQFSDSQYLPEGVRNGNGEIETPPELPLKNFKFQGVIILYYNGAQKLIVDDFEEFQEIYFNYLKRLRLDIQN